MIQVIYNGVDITDAISINLCIHDMYAEGRADTLVLRANDTVGLWDQWQPKPGDELSVQYGSAKSGKMYVHKCSPQNGLYTIKALSLPCGYTERKNKAWQSVKLLQIGKEIAQRHGLGFKSYGVTDQLYKYILQNKTSDFAFLHQRCKLEGCAFLVYDGVLVMYSEQYIEGTAPTEEITLSLDADFEFFDRSGGLYGSCIVERGEFKGDFNANNGACAVYMPMDIFTVSSSGEASRFAKNLLRSENKQAFTGYVRAPVLSGYAAASMAYLKNTRALSWDGPVFLHHIRNDYGACKSKIFFRRPLEGY